MARPNTIGNTIAPPRFLAFMVLLIVGVPIAAKLLGSWPLGAMAGFDVAAFVFLASCISLLGTREARIIREHAQANDANRIGLLVITGIVVAVLMIAITPQALGHTPPPLPKGLVNPTLAPARP